MSAQKTCFKSSFLILFFILVAFSQRITTQWETMGGGVGDDRFNAVIKLSDGYAFAGYFSDPSLRYRPYLARFDSKGKLLWSKTFEI